MTGFVFEGETDRFRRDWFSVGVSSNQIRPINARAPAKARERVSVFRLGV